MEKPKKLSYGISWLQWPVLIVLLILFGEFINSDRIHWNYLPYILFIIALWLWVSSARSLSFDEHFFYVNRPKRAIWIRPSRQIPLAEIVSIKRSAARVNGSRYWKVRYRDENGKERLIRYFSALFASNDKEFQQKVRMSNPQVIIWEHPHFHD